VSAAAAKPSLTWCIDTRLHSMGILGGECVISVDVHDAFLGCFTCIELSNNAGSSDY
jgi:hypothetical protein